MAKKPRPDKGRPFTKGNTEWKKSSKEGRGRRPKYLDQAIVQAMQAMDVGDYSMADKIMVNFGEMLSERVSGKTVVPTTEEERQKDPDKDFKVVVGPVFTKASAQATIIGVAYLYAKPMERHEHHMRDDASGMHTPEEMRAAEKLVDEVLKKGQRG